MNYRIIGDSCMDLTEEQRKDPHFTLIPFTLMVEVEPPGPTVDPD